MTCPVASIKTYAIPSGVHVCDFSARRHARRPSLTTSNATPRRLAAACEDQCGAPYSVSSPVTVLWWYVCLVWCDYENGLHATRLSSMIVIVSVP